MKKRLTLTEPQLAMLDVLWARGEATVADVTSALASHHKLAQTTVATTLSRLARKGVVSYRTEGRQYVYRAAVTEQQVRGSMIAQIANGLFHGDIPAFVSHLLSVRDVKADELERVRQLVEEKQRQLKSEASGE